MRESPVPRSSPEADESRSEASDRSLLARLKRGNEDAATQLYFRYARRLRALVRSRCSSQLAKRLEPDDIVQSVFRRFFNRVTRADYDVPPGEELWGLLLVIALNKLRSAETHHRAAKRDVRLCSDAAIDDRGEDDSGHLALSVEDALSQLPTPQRTMVELRIAGHEVAEIALSTGRSKRTVERLLQDVRSRLRRLLEGPD